MAKKSKNDNSKNLLAESERRISKRSKSIPAHLKETTFQEDLLKKDMQRKNATTTKNPEVKRNKQGCRKKTHTKIGHPQLLQIDEADEEDKDSTCKTNSTSLEIKENDQIGHELMQPIPNPKLGDYIDDKDTITTIEEEEYLLPFKRRTMGKFIVSDEEDEVPVKRRRLRKCYQRSNIEDQEEERSSLRNDNMRIKENRGKPLMPQSKDKQIKLSLKLRNNKDKKGNSTMKKKTIQQSHYCLIDEEEEKDNVYKDNNEWMEENNKIDLQDKEGNSDDNENRTNQLQDVLGINATIQHEEKEKTFIPINSIDLQSKQQWTIKVRVIRKGSIEQYSGANGSGSFWKVILMDHHGTSILAMAFNEAIDSMEQRFIKGRTYFISNADAKPINKLFANVHDSLEIRLTEQTDVQEALQPIKLEHLSHSPIPFNKLDTHALKEQLVDVFGVLSKVDPIKIMTKRAGGTIAMRIITLIDERSKSFPLTLWGDLANNEGTELQEIEDQKPVIGAFKVKSSFYKGQINLSAIATSSILINPPLPASNLFTKRHDMDGDHKEGRLVGHEIRNIQPTSALQTKQKIKIEKN